MHRNLLISACNVYNKWWDTLHQGRRVHLGNAGPHDRPVLGNDQFYADQRQHDDEQDAQETLGNEAAQVAADVDTGQ